MKTTLALIAGTLALASQAAHAQYQGDPNLDERVAQNLPPDAGIPIGTCDTAELDGYAARAAPTIWPGGIVPFEIEGTVADPALTLNGMDVWMFRNGAPNVTFVRRDPNNPAHADYLVVKGVAGSVSSSYIGRCDDCDGTTGNGQPVKQGEQVSIYVMAHEFCHALGFDHEHVRPDRDEYVDVWFSRITPGNEHNFQIRLAGDWPAGANNTAYDFESVMHYGACTFSNCSACACISVLTCTPLDVWARHDDGWQQCGMGNRSSLTTNDVTDMVAVYGQRPARIDFVGTPGPGSPAGTMSNPWTSPNQIPGDSRTVYFEGNRTYSAGAGTTFSAPATWTKHAAGNVLIGG